LSVDTAERPDGGEDLAALLKRLLAEKDKSQAWLAAETGIPLATINAWIVGRRTPKGAAGTEALRKLAEVLGSTPKEMFEATGRRAPGPLSQEREEKLLRIYRGLSTEAQRALIQTAEALARVPRAS
jgi:transcriptional regulator with XRE-family HTH domain